MPLRYFYGNRRRRIQVHSTSLPSASANVASQNGGTLMVDQMRRPKASAMRMPIALRTSSATGSPAPPPPGGGPSNIPPPVIMVRHYHDRYRLGRVQQPAIRVSSPYPRLTGDGYPNQTVVPILRPNRRPSPIIKQMGWAQATPIDGLPNISVVPTKRPNRRSFKPITLRTTPPAYSTIEPTTPLLVPILRPNRRWRSPIIDGTVATSGLGFLRPTSPVLSPIIRRRKPSPTPLIQSTDSPNTIISIPSSRLLRNILLPQQPSSRRVRSIIKASTPPNNQIVIFPAHGIVVPGRKRPVRSPIVLKGKQLTSQTNLGAFDPYIIQVPRRKRPVVRPIEVMWPNVDNVIPLHDPLPKTRIVPQLRRDPLLWPRPIIKQMAIQTSSNMVDGPWDIIAASILWLRNTPSIVAATGDGGYAASKFFSDIAPRDISPPYLVFYEPQEVEGFETTDGTTQSSLIEGVYRIDVFATGKLAARQLSEYVADALNDAPLYFQNGTLVYLRRVQRQYPTLEVPGTGTNVVAFKRMVEFEYKFERTYTLNG